MALSIRTEQRWPGRAARSDRAYELFRRARTSTTPEERRTAINTVIEMHLDAAHSEAQRYAMRGVPLEDLRQVAALALTKAAHRYDVDSGHDFMSYAAPTIRGDLRKHFRDRGWMIRPPRRIQDLQPRLRTAEADLSRTLGRPPRPTELAEHLDVPAESVIEAIPRQRLLCADLTGPPRRRGRSNKPGRPVARRRRPRAPCARSAHDAQTCAAHPR